MKKTGKKLLGKLFVFVVIGMSVAFMRGQTENVIASNIPENARVIQVESAADLARAISQANDDSASSDSIYPVYAELLADIEITSDSALPSLEKGELIVELNGYSISASLNGESVFTSVTDTSTDTSSLTIQDSSEMKQGTIENTGTSGGIISKNGGSLTITEGNLKATSFCIGVTNCETNISGGDFTASADSGNAMKVSGGSTVTVSGGTFTSNYITCSVTKDNNSVIIQDGTFTAEENETFGYSYAWYVTGKETSLTVSGGTFNLNAKTGSSLVIGEGLTDAMISLSGGVYNGRIAREAFSWEEGDYTVYYGDGSRGIIADGYVLTDNTFVSNGQPYAFTQDKVEIVPGAILKFNTQRSGLESIETDEEAEKMDFYTMQPISVGTDGTIYSNSTENTTPVIEQSATTNSYEFAGWLKNGTIYTDVNDYIESIGYLQYDDFVYGMWDAKVSAADGLQLALQEQNSIRNVELLKGIEPEYGLQAITEMIDLNNQRTLDLGGNTISLPGEADADCAVNIWGNWLIKNGTITAINSSCIRATGKIVLEDLVCKTENANYAVMFEEDYSTGSGLIGEIRSGLFETGLENGSAIGIQKKEVAETIVAEDELANILKGKYVSSTLATLDSDTGMIKSDGERLIVSEEPITYVQEGTEVSLGEFTYGESVTSSEQELNNKDYIGDIVITGISVDNPVFEVKQTGTQTKLLGGSETTYGYSVGIVGTPAPDTYEGTISITYTKMDKTTGTYTQPVSVTIEQKQLTIGNPSLTKTKVYDGTTAAAVTAGTLGGVITDADGAVDDVAVEATAEYDSADAGTGKTITVKYTLTGVDKDNYLAPIDADYTDGVIDKANGVAAVTMESYHVGETAPEPKAESKTNAGAAVTFYYKEKSAADTAYTTAVPAGEGSYTVKAVFAETANYNAAENTADFAVTYIDTPQEPYALAGTKGNNGWYTSGVTIYPAAGYLISDKQDGTYKNSYLVESTQSPVLYLKDENGAVTRAVQVEALQIDAKKPTISGITDGETYYDDNLKVVVSDENLESITLNGIEFNVQDGRAEIFLQPSLLKYVLKATDKAGNQVECAVTVEEAWMKQGIVSSGIRNLVTKKSYKFGTGTWKVSGDNTVYQGGSNFYATSEGSYNFQKQ